MLLLRPVLKATLVAGSDSGVVGFGDGVIGAGGVSPSTMGSINIPPPGISATIHYLAEQGGNIYFILSGSESILNSKGLRIVGGATNKLINHDSVTTQGGYWRYNYISGTSAGDLVNGTTYQVSLE